MYWILIHVIWQSNIQIIYMCVSLSEYLFFLAKRIFNQYIKYVTYISQSSQFLVCLQRCPFACQHPFVLIWYTNTFILYFLRKWLIVWPHPWLKLICEYIILYCYHPVSTSLHLMLSVCECNSLLVGRFR